MEHLKRKILWSKKRLVWTDYGSHQTVFWIKKTEKKREKKEIRKEIAGLKFETRPDLTFLSVCLGSKGNMPLGQNDQIVFVQKERNQIWG
jgi:hypothetical protein